MKGCRSTIRSLGSNDWIPLRIPMATGLERLHWVPREPNKQKRASMHPQPGRDSRKQQPRALWPFENVNFSIKKEIEKKNLMLLESKLSSPCWHCRRKSVYHPLPTIWYEGYRRRRAAWNPSYELRLCPELVIQPCPYQGKMRMADFELRGCEYLASIRLLSSVGILLLPEIHTNSIFY